jgi:hypothetical protein
MRNRNCSKSLPRRIRDKDVKPGFLSQGTLGVVDSVMTRTVDESASWLVSEVAFGSTNNQGLRPFILRKSQWLRRFLHSDFFPSFFLFLCFPSIENPIGFQGSLLSRRIHQRLNQVMIAP